jgi:hypothetical protein
MARACRTHGRGVYTRFRYESLKKKDNKEDLVVDGSYKTGFWRNMMLEFGLDLCGSEYRLAGNSCGHGDESSGSRKCEEFLERVSNR